MTALYTPWGEQLDRTCPLPEYPRPQLRRDSYLCLNGLWDYTVVNVRSYHSVSPLCSRKSQPDSRLSGEKGTNIFPLRRREYSSPSSTV